MSGLPPPPGFMRGLPPPPGSLGGGGGLPPPPPGMRGLPPPPMGMKIPLPPLGGLPPLPPQPNQYQPPYPQQGSDRYPRPPSHYSTQQNDAPRGDFASSNVRSEQSSFQQQQSSYAPSSYQSSAQRSYPPSSQQQGYPPSSHQQGYASQQQGYPPQQGGYPPNSQQQGYPPQQGYAPNSQQGFRAPQQGGYSSSSSSQHLGSYQPNSYPQSTQHQTRPERSHADQQPTNTVWIGNTDPGLTEDMLRQAFSPYGKIMRVDRREGRNYCFVHFRFTQEAIAAIQDISASGSLGPVKFSYGRMDTYTTEQLNAPYNPNEAPTNNNEYFSGDRRPKRSRDDDGNSIPPSKIVWIGNLPPVVTDNELRMCFEGFGQIVHISRKIDRRMAFVHFDNVESATHAIETNRGLVLKGEQISLNYGRPPQQDSGMFGADTGGVAAMPTNEAVTNVVYLGNLPAETTQSEIDDLFERFTGFINAKLLQDKAIAFGHFDTEENSLACRRALHGQQIHGVCFRVGFGKTNHTMTLADKERGDRPRVDQSDGSFHSSALVLSGGGALVSAGGVMDRDGGAGSALVRFGTQAPAVPALPTFYTRQRQAPTVTMDSRITSLLSASYHNCGEPGFVIRPALVNQICDAVDECIDTPTADALIEVTRPLCPTMAAHVYAILGKRLREHFNDDPHKKLIVLYAATQVLLSAQVTMQRVFSKSAVWNYLVLVAIVAEEQDASGVERLDTILENLKKNERFFQYNRIKEDALLHQQFKDEMDSLAERSRADLEWRKK